MLKFTKNSKKKKSALLSFRKAPDIKKRILHLKNSLCLEWINSSNIYCFRSENSRSRAYARIWGLSKVWQMALGIEASYIIEVLSEKFDHLSQKQKDEILLHEIAHIPKNFSGSLLPHIRKRGKRNFNDRVKRLISAYKNIS